MSAESLLEISIDDDWPDIVRATALDLLKTVPDDMVAAHIAPLIDDDDPLVRAAAVAAQRAASQDDRVKRLLPALDDPVRSVRIAAARELLDAPRLPAGAARTVGDAMKQWQASLLAKADFPETQMAIGGAALVQRNLRAAEQAFREAVRLDPQAVQGWVTIARILAATGDAEGVRATLDEGLATNPSNESLLSLESQLDAVVK